MKGSLKFSAKNNHIKFQFILERNVTIITGDSGTGKTKLINMVRQYYELGKRSGVSLSCDRECIVLEGKMWENTLENTHNSVVFIEESTSFLRSYDFSRIIQNTDNYYVIITREPLPQIPYSIDSIKQIIKKGKTPKIDKIYKNITVKKISKFPYDVVIVEDSKSGYQFFSKVTEKLSVMCVTANGKTKILTELKKYKGKRILVIADSAALGSEIREIENYRTMSTDKIDLFLPESFEWLILNSDIFDNNLDVKEILQDPVKYIESSEYFSWEKFFEALLVNTTKNSKYLRYKKAKISDGYLTDENQAMIVKAME